jgi:hypothetical protein
MKNDFSSIFNFLSGKPYNAEIILIGIEDLILWNAYLIHQKLDKETVVEVCSAFLADIMEVPKPVNDPVYYAHSHAKRCIYAAFKKEVSLESLAPIAAPTSDPTSAPSFEEVPEANLNMLVEIPHNVDFISPIKESKIDQRIRILYCSLVGSLSYEEAVKLSEQKSALGYLVSASLFRSMTQDKGYDLGSRVDEDFYNVLGMTACEEEVLIALMMARVRQKWVVPAYILMGSNFFVSMYSFWGEVLFPSREESFRSLFRYAQVYCYLDRSYKVVDSKFAEKSCAKKYGMRIRDVRNRYLQTKKILRMSSDYVTAYLKQLEKSASKFKMLMKQKEKGD